MTRSSPRRRQAPKRLDQEQQNKVPEQVKSSPAKKSRRKSRQPPQRFRQEAEEQNNATTNKTRPEKKAKLVEKVKVSSNDELDSKATSNDAPNELLDATTKGEAMENDAAVDNASDKLKHTGVQNESLNAETTTARPKVSQRPESVAEPNQASAAAPEPEPTLETSRDAVDAAKVPSAAAPATTSATGMPGVPSIPPPPPAATTSATPVPVPKESYLSSTLKRLEATNSFFSVVDFSKQVLDTASFYRLTKALPNQKYLTKLVLSDCHLGDDAITYLLSSVSGLDTTLEVLWLDGNELTARACRSIAKFLQRSRIMKRCFLPFNKIGAEGATTFMKVLPQLHNLEMLDVGENGLGNDGAAAFESLFGVGHVKELYLYGNSIGNEGAIALARGLKLNVELIKLDLRYNQFDNKGAIALADSCKQNHTLRHLAVVGNKIGSEGAAALIFRHGIKVAFFAGDMGA